VTYLLICFVGGICGSVMRSNAEVGLAWVASAKQRGLSYFGVRSQLALQPTLVNATAFSEDLRTRCSSGKGVAAYEDEAGEHHSEHDHLR
jgi:hypothetical protein